MEETNQPEAPDEEESANIKIKNDIVNLESNVMCCNYDNILDTVGKAIDRKCNEGNANSSSSCSSASSTSVTLEVVCNKNNNKEDVKPIDKIEEMWQKLDESLNSDDDSDEQPVPEDDPPEDVPIEPSRDQNLLEDGREPQFDNEDSNTRDSANIDIDHNNLADNSTEESEEEEELPVVLLKPKPKHSWFIVPEIQNRQFGSSARKQSSDFFQRRCYGSLHCVQRLELMYKLEQHLGCVNSINFHPNGTLLASGSDDLSIVVWDWKLGNSLLAFDSKHKSNVFQSKFLPLSGDLHIVSCARDGQVRLAQVSAQEGFKSSRKLGSHRGPSHKLTVLHDKPQVVISVGEDGVVLRHDLRAPKSEKITTVRRDLLEVALYSISSNPIDSNEYCVAGRDATVRTYDLRKGKVPLKMLQPFDKNANNHGLLYITCAVYNHNGSEILASYNDEAIYLFDTKDTGNNSYVHCYQGHRNEATIKGVNFFGPKSEFIVSGSDCGYVYFWEKNTEAIVQFLRADDNGVVNCLEPHPQLPFLATSGLDADIKIWVPSYEQDPKMENLAETVIMNTKARSSSWISNAASELDNPLIYLLWQQFQSESTGVDFILQDLNNQSSTTDESDTSSSIWTSSTSEHDSDPNQEGPDECSPS